MPDSTTIEGHIRDRVKEFRRVSASELLDNAGNWRRHPLAQRQAISGVLKQIGVAGALTAYRSERNGNALTLIDGHLRKGVAGIDWPTLILDLSDAEADKLLTVYDPIGAMAEADAEKLKAILATVRTEDAGLDGVLDELKRAITWDGDEREADPIEPPEEFKAYDQDLNTDYCCPKCGFAWSGKPK